MKKKGDFDNRARRYITITDATMWEQIDRIQSVETYSKSFNKVINTALLYGLPILEKQLFEQVTLENGETKYIEREGVAQEQALYFQLTRLMQEAITNLTVNKAVLSSLFAYVLSKCEDKELKQKLYDGELQETPDFMYGYEAEELKRIHSSK